MTQRILAILAAVSFLGLAVFGFLGMADHGFNTCLIRAVHGGVCPGNALSLLNFHLGALKIFSSVSLLDLTIVLLGALLLGWAWATAEVLIVASAIPVIKNYFLRLSYFWNSGQEQINRWLFRHETSPTFN